MPDFVAQRQNMVASQVHADGVVDESLLASFGEVPRERFVPAEKRCIAYADAAIELVHRRWLLAPRTFAKLLQLAEIEPTDSVLDVGCATGYSTAVLAKVARRVVGLEEDADLVRIASEALHGSGLANVSVVQGALAEGNRAAAPFDVIIVEGAIEQTPQTLLSQLAEGGRLAAVFQRNGLGQAILYLKEQNRVGHRMGFDASAPVLNGFRQAAGFVF
ncbi:MAG TPA: protein-L-isoaspartate O-methyltransferase [Rhizomicrobium sp.]|jgi:protein-L-isoaspartate(D-aspartate) O-methyltransferase|nr:protein-L-isoaspartate O-methyltransferase [Rhizomicrobium sp.]